MGDSWEDWDDEDVAVPAPVVPLPAAGAAGKFADEDAEEDAPKWEGTVPETKAVRAACPLPFLAACLLPAVCVSCCLCALLFVCPAVCVPCCLCVFPPGGVSMPLLL